MKILTLCSKCAADMKIAGYRIERYTMKNAVTHKKDTCEQCVGRVKQRHGLDMYTVKGRL